MVSPSDHYNPESAWLWWLVAQERTYVINEELLQRYREKGVGEDFIQKFQQAKGTYSEFSKLWTTIQESLGEGWYEQLKQELYPYTNQIYFKKISPEILGYEAQGWLGQYLVIFPKKKLIGVRMIREKESYNDKTDAMLDFKYYVYQLIK
ncbi:MAG: hypothetical protein AAFU64_06320, partial [Bacteroidota bacterium]